MKPVSPRVLRTLAAAVAVALLVPVAPAAGASDSAPPDRAASAVPAQAAPQQYEPDPNNFFTWYSPDSESDCGVSPWCEIEASQFFVPRTEPDWLYGIAFTSFTADGSLPIKRDSGVGIFLDVDRDGKSDYRSLAPAEYFAPNDLKSTTVERRSGNTWVDTGVASAWGIATGGWVVNMEWRRLGISGAAPQMVLCDSGLCDSSPGTFNDYINIKTFVDGPVPGKASALTVTYFPRKGGKVGAKVQWAYNGPGTPITRWYFRASGDNGRTWTGWKWTNGTATSVNITGLRKGKRGIFEIYAQNAVGNGPTTRLTLTP